MATQPPQSLPSFAQAFGAPSLSRISDANNALPPIHPRASPHDLPPPSPSAHDDIPHHMRDPPRQSSRKRAHPDASAHADDNLSSGSDERRSPKSVRIKEETEYDALPSPTSRSAPTPAHGEREPPHSSQEDADAASAAAMAAATATSPAPAPSAARPSPSKKRRVTISGISHPINTDVRPPPSTSTDPNTSQAISPVVMGLPIPRDDAAAIEQVRSMLTIKQQQKELIESRRGSIAGAVPVGSPSVSVNVVNASPAAADDRQPPSNKSHVPQPRASTGNGGRSPITAAPPRRSVVGLSANVPPNRALSPLVQHASPPPPHHHTHTQHGPTSSQTMLHPPPPPGEQHPAGSHHALPQPASSFARRRATRQLGSAGGPGSKGKPADIMISPRDALGDRLQPSIQSAPPIPRAATAAGQGMTGRFGNMALPSLPPVLGPGQSTQRMTVSRVPPTPTRLSMARNPAGTSTSILTPTVGSISGAASGRSPPTASVPIATTLVPPTPAALHANGYTGEKGAFLAPFAQFYDALADSRTLKQWLAEQLQKSQALATQLQRQQEHLDELVAAAVERKLGGVREEMGALQRRIDELEIALHHASGSSAGFTAPAGLGRTSSSGPGQAYSLSPNMGTVSLAGKGKAKVNGIPPSHQQHAHAHPHTPSHLPPHPYPPPHHPSGGVVPESYQFPPHPDSTMRRPEPVRRALSPTSLERERDGSGSGAGPQGSGIGNESRSFPGSQTGSPVPFDVGRRLSVSAIRLDPRSPATPSGEPPLHPSAHAAHSHGHSQAHPHAHPHGHSHSHRSSVVSLSGREREREREREVGGRPNALPPPPSAAPGGGTRTSGDNGGWNRTWSSPRAPRASLPSLPSGGAPSMTSATRSSLSQTTGAAGVDRDRDRERDREREHDRERGERPGLARRSSAQRVAGEGYAYALPEGGAGEVREARERERAEKEGLREKEREREMDVSHSPREVRSPEPMEE
ncbi:hypothetical protein C8Q73DRAFT_667725 [Cubamyces lactineus]|nr:hypothetical protein C8Q73DRAFT_667725 [Cubamyces lactineus]